jgi:hypothetical protein
MPTFPHQLKLLGATDRCRVANMVLETEVSSSNLSGAIYQNNLQLTPLPRLCPTGAREGVLNYKWNANSKALVLFHCHQSSTVLVLNKSTAPTLHCSLAFSSEKCKLQSYLLLYLYMFTLLRVMQEIGPFLLLSATLNFWSLQCRMRMTTTTWHTGFQIHQACSSCWKKVSRLLVLLAVFHERNLLSQHRYLAEWLKCVTDTCMLW